MDSLLQRTNEELYFPFKVFLFVLAKIPSKYGLCLHPYLFKETLNIHFRPHTVKKIPRCSAGLWQIPDIS